MSTKTIEWKILVAVDFVCSSGCHLILKGYQVEVLNIKGMKSNPCFGSSGLGPVHASIYHDIASLQQAKDNIKMEVLGPVLPTKKK